MKKLFITILLVGLCTSVAAAQSPWLSDVRSSSVSLEWDKPLLDSRTYNQDDISAASSVLFLTGKVRVNGNLRLVAELPMSHFGFKRGSTFAEDNSTMLGNVYVGGVYDLFTSDAENHAMVELGARIPTTRSPSDKRFANQIGAFSDIDRREAFAYDTWSIPLIATYIRHIEGPFAARVRLGTAYNIYTDDLKDLDNEWHLLYGISALYRQPIFEAQLGFMGRNQYAGNNVDFADSGFTQLRAGVARPFRNVVPGVYVRKPLGENYNALVDWAFGVNVEFRSLQR